MKKYLILSCLCVLGWGCAKPLPDFDPAAPTGTGPLAEVVFTPDDQAVGRWAVFAFDNLSGWYAYATSASGSPVMLNLRLNRRYTCYALVNYPTAGAGAFNPGAVRTPDDLTEKLAYLSDNAEGYLLMFGSASVIPTEVTANLSIRVSRLVSRVDIAGVAVDFSDKPRLAAKTFTLRHLYVTNAYRTARYGDDFSFPELSASRGAWYNTMGWHRGEAGDAGMDALLGQRNINAVISAGTPYTQTHSFYVFPNPTPDTEDNHDTAEWTVRSTRIILECTLDSDTQYYQISLPAMVRNHVYAASHITIRGRGSSDPEAIQMDPDATDITLLEGGWDTGADINL